VTFGFGTVFWLLEEHLGCKNALFWRDAFIVKKAGAVRKAGEA